MRVKTWLKKVAYIDSSDRLNLPISEDVPDSYFSVYDDSFITFVGEERGELLKFLAKHDVSEQLTCGMGFSPSENKWYGWSHRAIFGFTIGSQVKMGDCGYTPKTLEEYAQYLCNFYEMESWYIEDDLIHFKPFDGKDCCLEPYPINEFSPGRGEWIAKTLEDAKQMAKDFNEGVS